MRLHGDDRWILAVALLVLAPLGVMLINLVGTHWFPASDQALEVLRIGDVGGRRTRSSACSRASAGTTPAHCSSGGRHRSGGSSATRVCSSGLVS